MQYTDSKRAPRELLFKPGSFVRVKLLGCQRKGKLQYSELRKINRHRTKFVCTQQLQNLPTIMVFLLNTPGTLTDIIGRRPLLHPAGRHHRQTHLVWRLRFPLRIEHRQVSFTRRTLVAVWENEPSPRSIWTTTCYEPKWRVGREIFAVI